MLDLMGRVSAIRPGVMNVSKSLMKSVVYLYPKKMFACPYFLVIFCCCYF